MATAADGSVLTIALESGTATQPRICELVDYRLTQYRDRKRQDQPTSEGFVCKVTWNQRDPIVKLPPRDRAQVPEGEADVRLPDGAIWQFRFAKEFCNVARPAGTSRNQLPDLLRGWFGPRAGQPGSLLLGLVEHRPLFEEANRVGRPVWRGRGSLR